MQVYNNYTDNEFIKKKITSQDYEGIFLANVADFGEHSNGGILVPIYCIEALETVHRLNLFLEGAGLNRLDTAPLYSIMKNAIESKPLHEQTKQAFYNLFKSLWNWDKTFYPIRSSLNIIPNYNLLAYIATDYGGETFGYDFTCSNLFWKTIYNALENNHDYNTFEASLLENLDDIREELIRIKERLTTKPTKPVKK